MAMKNTADKGKIQAVTLRSSPVKPSIRTSKGSVSSKIRWKKTGSPALGVPDWEKREKKICRFIIDLVIMLMIDLNDKHLVLSNRPHLKNNKQNHKKLFQTMGLVNKELIEKIGV